MKTNKNGNLRKPNRSRLYKYYIKVNGDGLNIRKSLIDDDDKIIQVGPVFYTNTGIRYNNDPYIMVGPYRLNTITPRIVDIYLSDTTTEMLDSGEYIIITTRSEKRVVRDLLKYLKRVSSHNYERIANIRNEIRIFIEEAEEHIKHYNLITKHYTNIINGVRSK